MDVRKRTFQVKSPSACLLHLTHVRYCRIRNFAVTLHRQQETNPRDTQPQNTYTHAYFRNTPPRTRSRHHRYPPLRLTPTPASLSPSHPSLPQSIHTAICHSGPAFKTNDVRLTHILQNNSLHPSVNQMSSGSNPNDLLTSKTHITMIICPNPITEILIRILTRGR